MQPSTTRFAIVRLFHRAVRKFHSIIRLAYYTIRAGYTALPGLDGCGAA
jgi:hypothetical protein